MTFIFDLPPEIFAGILATLPLADLASCQRTCRYIHSLVKDSISIQSVVETAAAGVHDNPHSSLSLVNRLEILRNQENSWLHTRFSPAITVPVEHASSGIYDLTAGVYVLGNAYGFGPWTVTTAISYFILPSSYKTTEQPPWTRINLHRIIIDLGLCLREHGLAAIVTTRQADFNSASHAIEIVLLDFFAGVHHPEASRPIISVTTRPADDGRCSISTEIVGDYLALLLNFSSFGVRDVFHLYDWKTGNLMSSFEAENMTYCSLAFLAEDVILLPNMQDQSLEIHRILDGHMTLECTLLLPKLLDDFALYRLTCRAEPNPMGSSSIPKDNQKPYYNSSKDAIVIFDLFILNPFMSSTFVVHRSSLLALFDSNNTLTPIPWRTWGPPITRWFDTHGIPTRWITVTAGQRYAYIKSTAASHIHILDFNPYSISKYRSSKPSSSRIFLRDQSEIAPQNQFYQDEVWSELPYLETVTVEFYTYDAVLMDEERIIGIRLLDDDGVCEFDVLPVVSDVQDKV